MLTRQAILNTEKAASDHQKMQDMQRHSSTGFTFSCHKKNKPKSGPERVKRPVGII
jgi:hypothetical protein